MKRLTVLTLALLAACSSVLAESPVDRLLAYIPEDAAVVVVAPSAARLAEGVSAFGRAIAVDDLAEFDPHEVLSGCAIEELTGLDVEGPWALAWAPSRPAPLCLGLLKNQDAWLKAVAATPVEPGLWTVTIAGTPGTAGIRDGLLMFSDDEEIVRAALTADGRVAERFGADFARWAQTHHLTVGVRVAPCLPLVTPVLRMVQASAQMGMAMSGQQDEASLAFLNRIFAEAGNLLAQLDIYAAALEIDGQGLFIRDVVAFKPDSAAAAYVKKIRKVDRSLLRGLVDEDCLGLIAWEWELPPGTKSLSALLAEAMLTEMRASERLGAEKFQKGLQAMTAMYQNITGSNVAVALGPPEVGMTFSGVYFTRQGETVLENMRSAYELGPEFMGIGYGGGGKIEVVCRAETLDGAPLQVFEISFAGADPQAQRMIEAMYGQQAFITRALVGTPGVLFATGPEELARERLRQMRNGQGRRLADNPRIAAAFERIAPNPQFLALVDITKGFELALRAACCTGAPVPDVKLPKERGPYVVMGGYVDGSVLRGEAFVPARPIRILIDAVEEAERSEDDY